MKSAAKIDRKRIMQRAWELRRMGWGESFGECLRDAWAEAKGEVQLITVRDIPPANESFVSARTWWLGWLATAG